MFIVLYGLFFFLCKYFSRSNRKIATAALDVFVEAFQNTKILKYQKKRTKNITKQRTKSRLKKYIEEEPQTKGNTKNMRTRSFPSRVSTTHRPPLAASSISALASYYYSLCCLALSIHFATLLCI